LLGSHHNLNPIKPPSTLRHLHAKPLLAKEGRESKKEKRERGMHTLLSMSSLGVFVIALTIFVHFIMQRAKTTRIILNKQQILKLIFFKGFEEIYSIEYLKNTNKS
jgi:hypothetical protein